jgi:hypothetical protein
MLRFGPVRMNIDQNMAYTPDRKIEQLNTQDSSEIRKEEDSPETKESEELPPDYEALGTFDPIKQLKVYQAIYDKDEEVHDYDAGVVGMALFKME